MAGFYVNQLLRMATAKIFCSPPDSMLVESLGDIDSDTGVERVVGTEDDIDRPTRKPDCCVQSPNESSSLNNCNARLGLPRSWAATKRCFASASANAWMESLNISLFRLMSRSLAMFLSLSAISSGKRMDKVVIVLVTSIFVPV